MLEKIKEILIALLPLIIILFFWEYKTYNNSVNMFLFSSPLNILESLYNNLLNGVLLNDFKITFIEVLIGFIIGNVFGAIIGISLWLSPKIAKYSQYYITGFSAIPVFALAPMMIIWFGTGLYAKVMMVILSTITIAISQAFEGAKNVDNNQINLLKSFGASNFQIFYKLIIPSSLVWVFNGLKISVGFAVLGAFIGEFISSDSGLAYRILSASGLYDVSLVIASLILFILLVFILTFFVKILEKIFMPWKKDIFLKTTSRK